jgi:succinoglycan biosynthesis transport protein ExoP
MDTAIGREIDRPIPQALIAAAPPPPNVLTIWAAIARRRGIILAAFLLVFGVGCAVTLSRPTLYQATSLLMMSPREPQGVVTDQQDQPMRPADTGYVDSQVEILNSPSLAAQLVDRLHLDRDTEWSAGADDRDAVVQNVARAILAKRRGSTYVVEVNVRSREAQKAARMSNALVALYMDSRSNARIQNSERTSAWLVARLNELRGELGEREAAVQAFRAQQGLLTVNGVSLTETQLQEAEAAVLAARVDQAERAARLRQAANLAGRGGSGETMAGALTSDVMAGLRAREADIDRRLAEYADRYGDEHPTMIAVRAEKEDIERQIAAEVARLRENLRDEAEVSQARAGTLQGHLSSVRSELIRNNAQTVRLNELERDAAAARIVYESFLQRYHELANGAAGVGGDAQSIAPATPPARPMPTHASLMLALSAVVGALAGAFCALMAERLGTKLYTAEDVEQKIGLPILSSIPKLGGRELNPLPVLESSPGGFLAARPRSAFAEAFRLLRLRVMRGNQGQAVTSVAVASALPGEGKTSTALCLARIAAMAMHKVILVDCDLRGRSLNVVLGIEPKRGIVEVLRGEAKWRDVVGEDEASGAHVIAAAGDCFTSQNLFSSRAFGRLLDELSAEYELVVLDCPPVLTLAEGRDIAAQTDGVVLVARRGQTTQFSLRKAIRELNDVGANVIGVAFNAIDVRAPGNSSYSDPLYFSHAQKGMYTT